jgi:hypothetical protein
MSTGHWQHIPQILVTVRRHVHSHKYDIAYSGRLATSFMEVAR